MSKTRTVKDSMGELEVPENALYGAQTQRAIDNFPVSGIPLPAAFLSALGLVKRACAQANHELGLMEPQVFEAIERVVDQLINNQLDNQFPVDIFQTGSGTSTNMNANEVLAQLASEQSGLNIHPNDHINMSQSSNDVIPTTIHVSASIQCRLHLIPSLKHLISVIDTRSHELSMKVKTGRTHLMDAMPVTFGQELSGWASQLQQGLEAIENTLGQVQALSIGGTAVGTGINAHEAFASSVVRHLSETTGITFTAAENRFAGMSSQDAVVGLSGQIKRVAVSMMKIANDLRWMNSGPLAGLGEISLPALQPGSSIMPGKVNPVIPESVAMVCAKVIGNDTSITIAGQSGNFQLNVMLPLVAHDILQSIHILANASRLLADKAVGGFEVNESAIDSALSKNPILVTALNRVIGYELGAKIAKQAYQQGRPVIEVASELTDLNEDELKALLDPGRLTKGGIVE